MIYSKIPKIGEVYEIKDRHLDNAYLSHHTKVVVADIRNVVANDGTQSQVVRFMNDTAHTLHLYVIDFNFYYKNHE